MIWNEYIDRFDYFSLEGIRPGCEPLRLPGSPGNPNAIVLVHGLTDSPHFMKAIASCFNEQLGYAVYLPLLQGHGLKEPKGMEDVSLDDWKANVEYAIETARAEGKIVSIGGLSTGGALSVYEAIMNPGVQGAVFLFSAALDIGGKKGDFKEWFLRTPFAHVVDAFKNATSSLIGDNPYRYSQMDVGGAIELSRLIAEIDSLTGTRGQKIPVKLPLFVCHSDADRSADIEGVEELLEKALPRKSGLYRIPAERAVSHASLVLREPITNAEGEILEPANPVFEEMMQAVVQFAQDQLSLT